MAQWELEPRVSEVESVVCGASEQHIFQRECYVTDSWPMSVHVLLCLLPWKKIHGFRHKVTLEGEALRRIIINHMQISCLQMPVFELAFSPAGTSQWVKASEVRSLKIGVLNCYT
jgi:hypothetical protein